MQAHAHNLMANAKSQTRLERVASFRLRRHHLLQHSSSDAVTIARDICGVQAQIMVPAFLQLWTRNHAITRSEVENALWQKRTLVKTSLMRQTVHLIPTDEFQVYIAALRPSRVTAVLRVMARCGIEREEGEALTPLIMDALSAGPLGRVAIADEVRPKVSKRMRSWMEKVWSIVRLPVSEGLVCYGPGEGNKVTFIRVDQWLPKLKAKVLSPAEAQCALMRKYLRAYGPATLRDFSHWSGIPMQEVKPLPAALAADLTEIPGETKNSFLLREDAVVLAKASRNESSVRLLPLFDPYLLAHHEKDHLLAARHYKRVYRNQGWISPVVLVDGEVVGVWSHNLQNKNLQVRIEPFGKLSKSARAGIDLEAESLAAFFGSKLQLHFA